MNFEEIKEVFESAVEAFGEDEESHTDFEYLFLSAIKSELEAIDKSIPSTADEVLRLTTACARIPGLLYLVELY